MKGNYNTYVSMHCRTFSVGVLKTGYRFHLENKEISVGVHLKIEIVLYRLTGKTLTSVSDYNS